MARASLAEAIAQFHDHREACDLAAGTRRRDRYVLKRFAEINGARTPMWNIGKPHVNAYLADAKERRPRSMHLDHATLKKFFEFCREEHLMRYDSNPMWGLKPPKLAPRDRQIVPARDFDRLLDAAEHPQARILIAIGLNLMLRQSEIITLRVKDWDDQASKLAVELHKIDDRDKAPVRRRLDREMRSWLTYYTRECGQLQPHWYLVPAKWGPRPTNDPVTGWWDHVNSIPGRLRPTSPMTKPEEIVQRALVRIGFQVRDPETGKSLYEGEHTLRRSGARALFEELKSLGVPDPLEVVQHMLNHKTRSQTEHYLNRRVSREVRDRIMLGIDDHYPVSPTNVLRIKGGRDAVGEAERSSV